MLYSALCRSYKNSELLTIIYIICLLGLWQDVGSGGPAGVASVRRDKGLPPCQTESISAGSKTDPPLVKAEPTNCTSSTSVMTYLGKD